MHFLEKGIINCFSLNERQTILRLRTGDFIGEKALLYLTKRIYPMAAESFCHVLSLSKRSFDSILSKFPQIDSMIREKCKDPLSIFNNLVQRRLTEMELNEEVLTKLSSQLKINEQDPTEIEFIENKELLQRILLSMEIIVQTSGTVEMEDNEKPAPKAFDLKKIKIIVDQDSDISSRSHSNYF